MTDDLTPEEREALDHLPRERMPSAALENRVVGAMRERGILAAARPGRVVRLTTSRVAGLLAACLVLMIGAYSIGIHRGDDHEMLRSVQVQAPAPAATQEKIATEMRDEAPLAKERQVEPESKDADRRTDEKTDAPAEGLAAGRVEDAVSESATSPRRKNEQPAAPATSMLARESPTPSTVLQRTVHVGGIAFVVDAPDSVRIVQDPDGRTLLIYTSDGIIRIRLAD